MPGKDPKKCKEWHRHTFIFFLFFAWIHLSTATGKFKAKFGGSNVSSSLRLGSSELNVKNMEFHIIERIRQYSV